MFICSSSSQVSTGNPKGTIFFRWQGHLILITIFIYSSADHQSMNQYH